MGDLSGLPPHAKLYLHMPHAVLLIRRRVHGGSNDPVVIRSGGLSMTVYDAEYNLTPDSSKRLGDVLLLWGQIQTHVPELNAGDLGTVTKLSNTHTGEALANKATVVSFDGMTFPEGGGSRMPSSRRCAATRTRSALRCDVTSKKTPASAGRAIHRPTSRRSPGSISYISK